MRLAQTLEELKEATNKIVRWQASHLPKPEMASRCFEFATLLRLVEELSTRLKTRARVVPQGNGTFAGAPASRVNYNYVEIGDYLIYFGVQFAGQSGCMHAPDIVVSHRSKPDLPPIVLECKHYSGASLPKPTVMAFVAVLCDLRWAVFIGCQKLNSVPLYPGESLLECVDIDPRLCFHFDMCKHQLVSTVKPSEPMYNLAERYEFRFVQEKPWGDA